MPPHSSPVFPFVRFLSYDSVPRCSRLTSRNRARRGRHSIADFFRIPGAYLLGGGDDIPERVDAQLSVVKKLRAKPVVNFAAKTFGDVSPEMLRSLTELLENPDA